MNRFDQTLMRLSGRTVLLLWIGTALFLLLGIVSTGMTIERHSLEAHAVQTTATISTAAENGSSIDVDFKTAANEDENAQISTRYLPPSGTTTVQIEYDSTDPDHARLIGSLADDNQDIPGFFVLGLPCLILGVGFLYASIRWFMLVKRARAARAARAK